MTKFFNFINLCLFFTSTSTLSLSENGKDVVIAIAPDIPENKESLREAFQKKNHDYRELVPTRERGVK